jgi:hypothetical protein
MIATGRGDMVWPPMGVAISAVRHARVQNRHVYLFATDGAWRMTTELAEVPANSATWEFPANRNEPQLQKQGRR